MQVSAIGRNSVMEEEVDFFGIGKVTDVFHRSGVMPAARHSWKRSLRRRRNWEMGSFSLVVLCIWYERGSANTLSIRMCRPSIPQFFWEGYVRISSHISDADTVEPGCPSHGRRFSGVLSGWRRGEGCWLVFW